MTHPASTPRPLRLKSLDGARGLAALIVLIHHCALTVPEFADVYLAGHIPAQGTLLWWITATPLKIFTAGSEAVLLFFVLSGLVVSLPVLRARTFDWAAYFITRTLRLWLPVAASLLLAAVCVALVIRDPSLPVSRWVKESDVPLLDWPEVVGSLDAVRGPTRINNPLWSLQWEFMFSLLLPLFVGIAVVLRRWTVVTVTTCAALTVVGMMNAIGYLSYLSAFMAGAALAFPVIARGKRYRPRGATILSRALWLTCCVFGILLMCAYWSLLTAGVTDPLALAVGKALALPGAVLIVLAAVYSRTMARFLEWRPVQWLGTISFSLYLVHVPIILMFSRLFGSGHWMRSLLFAVPTAFAVAWVFSKLVELPSHRLAKRVGRKMSASLADYVATTTPPAVGRAPQERSLVTSALSPGKEPR
jgi:peptidoglycan/LPS O-acetylase OafA/YrhL